VYTDGIIVRWDDAKGFGFAATKSSVKDIFIHISDFESSPFRPVIDQQISFVMTTSAEGRLKGEQISFRGKMLQRKSRKLGKVVPFILLTFIGLLSAMILNGKLPALVGCYYLLMSAISYICYARDKRAAQVGAWRISEASLQLVSLVGGWPGAWLAQINLRHKSQKRSFKWLFYLTVVINLVGLSWLFTEHGGLFIQSLAININFQLLGLLSQLDFVQFWWWKLNQYLAHL